jgi:hypothetical protein
MQIFIYIYLSCHFYLNDEKINMVSPPVAKNSSFSTPKYSFQGSNFGKFGASRTDLNMDAGWV